ERLQFCFERRGRAPCAGDEWIEMSGSEAAGAGSAVSSEAFEEHIAGEAAKEEDVGGFLQEVFCEQIEESCRVFARSARLALAADDDISRIAGHEREDESFEQLTQWRRQF